MDPNNLIENINSVSLPENIARINSKDIYHNSVRNENRIQELWTSLSEEKRLALLRYKHKTSRTKRCNR